MTHVGELLTLGLFFARNALVGVGLPDKIFFIASGKFATGFDMVLRMAMGADMCQNARAAAYHHNTMHGFLEIVGAMGLTNPSYLSPDYMMEPVSNHVTKSLSEIYEFVTSGQLL